MPRESGKTFSTNLVSDMMLISGRLLFEKFKLYQEVFMSMRIQDALSNCCEGAKTFASEAAAWFGKTVTAIGAFIADSAQKVSDFVKPHFENLKTFVQQNKESIIIASIAFAVGAIATAIVTQVFCRGTGNSGSTSATTSTSAATV
jgi:hypothetical protein